MLIVSMKQKTLVLKRWGKLIMGTVTWWRHHLPTSTQLLLISEASSIITTCLSSDYRSGPTQWDSCHRFDQSLLANVSIFVVKFEISTIKASLSICNSTLALENKCFKHLILILSFVKALHFVLICQPFKVFCHTPHPSMQNALAPSLCWLNTESVCCLCGTIISLFILNPVISWLFSVVTCKCLLGAISFFFFVCRHKLYGGKKRGWKRYVLILNFFRDWASEDSDLQAFWDLWMWNWVIVSQLPG